MDTYYTLTSSTSNAITTAKDYYNYIQSITHNNAISSYIWYPFDNISTATTTNWYDYNAYYLTQICKSPQEKLKDILKERLSPRIITRKHLDRSTDVREERARDTLKRLIGDNKYRLFVKHGFVSVKQPKSGKVYQIFPGHGITQVYKDGQMIERLCVVLKGNFPPTDSVIVRYLMILNNEEEFSKLAVKHSVFAKSKHNVVLTRSLPEVYAKLKAA